MDNALGDFSMCQRSFNGQTTELSWDTYILYVERIWKIGTSSNVTWHHDVTPWHNDNVTAYVVTKWIYTGHPIRNSKITFTPFGRSKMIQTLWTLKWYKGLYRQQEVLLKNKLIQILVKRDKNVYLSYCLRHACRMQSEWIKLLQKLNASLWWDLITCSLSIVSGTSNWNVNIEWK